MSVVKSAGSMSEAMLAEFEIQAPITKKFLERLPEEKLMWKPHEKSLTAGQLAFHLASVPGNVARAVQTSPQQFGGFVFPQPESKQEILDAMEASVAALREVLPTFDDAAMAETWRLMAGDQQIVAMPRGGFLRDVMLSHWYQHRGQMCVYLRLLDVAVPSSWGPSGDETPGM